jgi:hypothetical protein
MLWLMLTMTKEEGLTAKTMQVEQRHSLKMTVMRRCSGSAE